MQNQYNRSSLRQLPLENQPLTASVSAMTAPEQFPGLVALSAALQRSLTVFDLETTGMARSSGVVELGLLFVKQDGRTLQRGARVNPEMPITPQASKVHGIYDKDVENCHTLQRYADTLLDMFHRTAVIGFNSRTYDIPVLQENGRRYGIELDTPVNIDVRRLWTKFSGSNKGKLVEVAEHYGVKAGQAHAALGDVLTTARILDKMVERHSLEKVLEVAELKTPPGTTH